MAISKKAGVVTAQEAPKADVKSVSGTSKKSDEFRLKGQALRAQMTDDQKAIEGSKSDKVAFICALGDPTRKQDRVEKNENITSYVVVGYKFKVLEDMDVPVSPLKPDWKFMTDTGAISMRHVKAGEVVSLNLIETAAFISRPEFAGKFTGEGDEVILSAKNSASRPEPLPILKKGANGGSIKANMEFVAEIVGAENGGKGTAKVKDEYVDIFSVLYTKKSAGRKTATTAKKAGEASADIAAAFRNLYASRQA